MKRIFEALAGLVLGFASLPTSATPLTATAGGVTVSTCDHDAGAICSVVWNGKQFINDYDHGRQLQSAASFDNLGEAYNPTEAGAGYPYNGLNPSPSSSVYYTGSNPSPSSLKTAINMAYWKPVNGQALSHWVHSKQVDLYPGIYATYMKYAVQMGAYSNQGEPNHFIGQFEALTGYMPPEFSAFYTMDLPTGTMTAMAVRCTDAERSNSTCASPEQNKPLIFATSTGSHAMGIYTRELPQSAYPAAGFGRWAFTASNVVKWNAVYRLPNIVPGVTYYFNMYVLVGTLDGVKQQMQWLYNNGY